MSTGGISEPQFLLTELRYTLGQLNVQIGGLTAEQQQEASTGGSTIEELLQALIDSEQRYQQQYARLTGVQAANPPGGETGSPAERFEQMRLATIAQLEQAPPEWSSELRDAVREQISTDRQRTTQIANDRRLVFEQHQRPDLEEPLTQQPEPHALEQPASSEESDHPEPLR